MRLAALALVGLASLPAAAALVEIKHFDEELAALGVGADYSEQGMTALIEAVKQQVSSLEGRAAAAPDGDRKDLERTAQAVEDALEQLTASSNRADRAAAFATLKSLLYSVRASLEKRKSGMIRVAFGILGNLSLKLPYLSPEERLRPLTLERARLEAVNLEDARTGQAYSKPEELVGLSSDQVSRLDVRPDNHLWYTEDTLSALKAKHHTAWEALEHRLEARVAKAIEAPYSLDRARRVLLFDGIKSSGTSPKVETEDLHGQDWTVKWGDEVQTTALANRLYVELGGKFTDLAYANKGGQEELMLVLSRPVAGNTAPSCEDVATLEELKRCLLESKYEFDVSRHVVGHGQITEDTLRQEPFASASVDKKELIGRRFVTFNESLVEFEPDDDDYLRLGGGPMSSGGALDDRVKRALALFTYWILNKDGKDDNSKGVIDRQSSDYIEYVHDLGASLGSLRTSGNPNLLKVGDSFVRRRGDTIRFTDNMLYLPKAFEHATHADALWMARKIVGLSRETILSAVASTAWPDFQQQVMASRLIARRNAIARAFDLGDMMTYDAEPTLVSLRTPGDRLAVVRRYHLAIAADGDERQAVESLERFMTDCGIELQDGQAPCDDRVDSWLEGAEGEPESRVLKTTACRKSVLVAWLERTVHPAGLSRRIHRSSDEDPLEDCRPD